MNQFLIKTNILDYDHPMIQKLIDERGWEKLAQDQKKKEIYKFIRDEIKFGYNRCDSISASEVLQDGYGQCNTKGSLLMALLRAVGIPCRIHGFYIDKVMQKGAVTGLLYILAPKNIIHSWVEIMDQEKLTILEGFILDKAYMCALMKNMKPDQKQICGFGASTSDLPSAINDWDGSSNTYIQNESIIKDLGIYDSPDEFYKIYGGNLSGFRKWIFEKYARFQMNQNVERMRNS
ncbi:MAG: transglutaminase [Oligoflexia bacterium]|nr:MAG: transglutaminase [Oligoflexia bacterium]